MKNQYYGDINDYRKYGLLRTIARISRLSVLVNWMLTPDDTGPDGKFIQYLSQPARYRHHDPELFDSLKSHVEGGIRKVSLIEKSGLLPVNGFYSETVPDDRSGRARWFDGFLNSVGDSNLVFFDPDNGLEVKSVAFGCKNSSKYLYWRELERVWDAGLSVLLYQHFPRKSRSEFTDAMIRQVRLVTKASDIKTFATANVLFLLAVHSRHRYLQMLPEVVKSIRSNWGKEFDVR